MNLKVFYKYWLFPILWMLLIFAFSSIATVKTVDIYWKDFIIKKSAHIFEFGVLALFLYRAVRRKLPDKKAAYWVFLFCVLYAFSDEYHQSFTPGRDPTLRDVIFDTIGTLAALLIAWKYLPKAKPILKTLAKNWELI